MNRIATTPSSLALALIVLIAALFLGACALGPTAPTPPATPIALTPTITSLPDEAIMDDSVALTDTMPAEPAIVLTPLAEVTVPAADAVVAVTNTVSAPLTTTEPATVTALVSDNQPIAALAVGVNAALDPFELIDEAGNLVGFDIDLMNALAQAASIEVSFVTMDFDQLLPAVVNGDIDVAISAISRTAEREAVVAFTDPYFTSDQSPISFFGGGQGLAVRTETTNLQTLADLTETVTIGVKSGTTGDAFVVENTPAQIVRYDEAPAALTALANGEVAAVVTDISVIAEFVMDNPTLDVQLMGTPLTIEEYAIAVNSDRIDLLQLLNAGLAKLRNDGTYDLIFDKWFTLP